MPLQNIPDARKDISQDKVYRKFTIDRPGKVIFVGHHLSTKTTVRCLVRKISLSGADLEVSRYLPVPKNFFLEILGIKDEIGCTLIRREQEVAVVGFNMLIDPEFLHHVVKLSFEFGH